MIYIIPMIQEKEFLDFKLKWIGSKLSVDIYYKPTNSFTHVMVSTCYPVKNINKVPQAIALRLRRICYTTEKYQSRTNEYKNYLLVLNLSQIKYQENKQWRPNLKVQLYDT